MVLLRHKWSFVLAQVVAHVDITMARMRGLPTTHRHISLREHIRRTIVAGAFPRVDAWGQALPALVALILGLIVLGLISTYWYVGVAVIAGYGALRFIRLVRKNRYFSGEAFLGHQQALAAVVAEHNDVAQYATELQGRGLFALGASTTGTQAHLATFENTSQHKYQRDRNVARYQTHNVHNCSLQVVRNASSDPIKYLMKYFNIKADEASLANVETLSESLEKLENAVRNLGDREASITQTMSPPAFILKHYKAEFLSRVGFELPAITVPYPEYDFEYVSAGGNSSQRTRVTLNTPTTDSLIETLGQKIRFSKSAAGQRSLMTAKLRNGIKMRDGHTCQNHRCGISLAREPHLLLEVDHVVPVSRGGLSTPENLQTLCWRCNRTKSDKMSF